MHIRAMKTKEELLAMSHEELANYTVEVQFKASMYDAVEQKNSSIKENRMYDELYQLEEELKKVESCKLEYLPEYGYSSKEEIIQLIKEDISDVKGQIDQNLKLHISKLSSGYTDKILEEERTSLCLAQGLSRYC